MNASSAAVVMATCDIQHLAKLEIFNRENTIEALQWRLQKEKQAADAIKSDYLTTVQHHGMKSAWRAKICQWMFATGHAFDLAVETVACALHLMDRYLSAVSVDRAMLQLLSMVCMFVASKVNETQSITMEEMDLMCEKRFTHDEIKSLELELMTIVRWQLSPPNAFTFAREFIQLLPVEEKDEFYDAVSGMLEVVVEDVESLQCTASSLAMAAVQWIASTNFHQPVSATKAALSFTKITKATYTVAFRCIRHAIHASSSSEHNQSTLSADISCSPTSVDDHRNDHAVEADLPAMKASLLQSSSPFSSSSSSRSSSDDACLSSSSSSSPSQSKRRRLSV